MLRSRAVEASTYSVEIPVAEIIIPIFNAPDPIVVEGVFDAAAERPPDESIAAARALPRRRSYVGRRLGPAYAGRRKDKRAIGCVADTARIDASQSVPMSTLVGNGPAKFWSFHTPLKSASAPNTQASDCQL